MIVTMYIYADRGRTRRVVDYHVQSDKDNDIVQMMHDRHKPIPHQDISVGADERAFYREATEKELEDAFA